MTTSGLAARRSGRPVEGPDPAALGVTAAFVRRHVARLAAISAVLLVPCFWHGRIQAGDLSSHVYNAWLVQLIERGEAPGLWIASQWHNVLFDRLLSGLIGVLGLRAGEKLAVAAAVLVFFWAAFAFVAAVARRPPWLLLPALAMVAYGWTFHAGFFNYYLSIGLAFLWLAWFWRGRAWERALALTLSPLIVVAHPLGFVWFAGAALHVAASERMPRSALLLLPASVGGLLLAGYYLGQHYRVMGPIWPVYLINGADQLYLFGPRYSYPMRASALLAMLCIALDGICRRREPGWWKGYMIPVQLYVVAQVAVFALPSVVFLPRYPAPIALLVERLSLVSAILACAVLAAMRLRPLHGVAIAAIATVFFGLVHRDTAMLNRMEEQAERLVRTLPPGQRVLGAITAEPGSRIWIHHLVARACVGHCFAYGNYEPVSGQFRVRARPGSPITLSTWEDALATESGRYVVRSEDMVIYQVHRCSGQWADVCLRGLAAGEVADHTRMPARRPAR